MYTMKLPWKEFNVDLKAVEAFARAQSDLCTGTSGDYDFQVHFESEPEDEVKEAIQAKWDEIEADSAEAESYKSKEEIAAEVEVKKNSAKSKLLALGLTEEEIAALSL